MRRVALLVGLFAIAGCGKRPPAAESEKVKAFKEAARLYLDEARAAAETLRTSPPDEEADRLVSRIEELYSKLPPMPEEMVYSTLVPHQLMLIRDDVRQVRTYIRAWRGWEKAGANAERMRDEDVPRMARYAIERVDRAELLIRLKQ